MIVLGVDTGGGACSVALWRDGAVLAHECRPMARGHAELLVPMIAAAAERAGIALDAIDLYGVTIGPGAFTGLRIGIATVAGMALASGRPIVGVDSFVAHAAAVPAGGRAGRTVLVAIDSRRAELFVRTFHADLTPASAGDWLAPAALPRWLPPGPLLVVGDAAGTAAAALDGRPETVVDPAGDRAVDPGVVAALAAADAGRATREPPAPAYLRPPDAIPAAPASGPSRP